MGLHAVYDRLPAPLRTVAASARGAQLSATRYGRDLEHLVREAHERELWDRARWEAWAAEVVPPALRHAARHVPAHRATWACRPGDPGDLAAWPVLGKEPLRADPRAFVADDAPRGLVADHTSGTTGTPLQLWADRGGVRAWYALFEARVRRWHGVDRHTPVGMFGGQLVVPPARDRPPYWVWNAPMRQLYVSVHHIRPDRADAIVAALRARRVRYLLGYTSALVALARAMEAAGTSPLELEVVVTNAEPASRPDRARIEAAFGAPVRATYGLAEAVAAGVECAAGRLHLMPDVGPFEVVGPTRPGEPEGMGEIVATSVLNRAMPLVRYQVGDRATPPRWAPCRCGLLLPWVETIEGRSDDVVWTPDGRAVGRLDPVFKADLPVVEAQVVQEELDRIRVRVVPAPGWDDAARRVVAARTRERIGDVRVEVEVVDALERTAGGKLRAVVSHVEGPPEGGW